MKVDVAVVGGGIVGGAAALALDRAMPGRVVHVAPATRPDGRTTALLNPSIALLDKIGVWKGVRHAAAALKTMRLLDGTKRLLRARPLDFAASEVAEAQFGYNIPNDVLLAELARVPGPQRVDAEVVAARPIGNGWELRLAGGGAIEADALVGADGRHSMCREAAGIGIRRWSYPQVALVTTFAHENPHEGVSVEFHTETGPFTQVPLPPEPGTPHRSSLVWVVPPEDAEAIRERSRAAIATKVAERLEYMFGDVTLEDDLSAFPLVGMAADSCGARRVLLVGEAAHVFPPIGAQGANLGFRDVADCVDALARHTDADAAARAYARSRLADVTLRTAAVDALNRSLLTGFLPAQAARAFGATVLGRSASLRRGLMKAGLGVSSGKDRPAAHPSSSGTAHPSR